MLNPLGHYNLTLNSVIPSGPYQRVVDAHIGGALWRAIDMYGAAGMPAGTIPAVPASGEDPEIPARPASDLPPFNAGAPTLNVLGVPYKGKTRAYPLVAANPGGVNDELDDVLDDVSYDAHLIVNKLMVTYQPLKDWVLALGGTFEPIPVRP